MCTLIKVHTKQKHIYCRKNLNLLILDTFGLLSFWITQMYNIVHKTRVFFSPTFKLSHTKDKRLNQTNTWYVP